MVNPDKINESEINLESTGLVDECLNRLSSTELNKIICSGLFQPIRVYFIISVSYTVQINEIEIWKKKRSLELVVHMKWFIWYGSYDMWNKPDKAGILSNLTCNSWSNKHLLVSKGGVEKIVRMIQRVSADEDEAELHDDIVVPGITTLRHVTRDRGSNLGFAEAGFRFAHYDVKITQWVNDWKPF